MACCKVEIQCKSDINFKYFSNHIIKVVNEEVKLIFIRYFINPVHPKYYQQVMSVIISNYYF